MTMSAPKLDGRIERGAHTRRAILERAAAIASVEGLDRLSIGRLATELRASKSGVFAHFGSKEELQLATVQWAGEVFVAEVIAPALRAPGGLRRLWRLCDGWLDYSKRRVFHGGCFFVSVAAEFDARPGRVRDEIADPALRGAVGLHAGPTRDAESPARRRSRSEPAA